MFSVVFPGQGSQKIGMAKEFFDKYEIVKKIFKDADNILEFPISKIILEIGNSRISSAFLNIFFTISNLSKNSLAIPIFCDPWPGKTTENICFFFIILTLVLKLL